MKISYDPEADAIYIYLSEKKKSNRTEEIGSDLVVDYSGKELIGIEVLDASKKLPRTDLDRVTFTFPTYKGIISKTF